jgi:DGQHR domain-containing protein
MAKKPGQSRPKVPEAREYLSEMLSDPKALASENRARRKQFDTTAVSSSRVPELLEKGWEKEKKLKKRIRLRRPKTHDERLENRFWCLLYRLGYPELSHGRQFKVLIRRRGAEELTKQIDVLAKDDETVIVAECKSQEALRRRSLQKALGEFASLKGAIAAAVKRHYGNGFKPKIIWLFVTDNIVWSQPDKERASGHSIHRVTERELRYFSQLANHLGPAARYQFLAEFLEGQKIPALADRKIPAIRGKLGGKSFYCFVTTPGRLLKIAFVNHRSLNDPGGVPSYQRLVGPARLRKIAKFIEGGGFFPTNLLVNFKKRARFEVVKRDDEADVTYGYLYLPDRYKSAWIIDGQHRLYGYSRLDQNLLRQNLMVVAFERLEVAEEANLFVTINHEQKSVPRTLLDDLEGDLKWGSEVPTERIGAVAARLIGYLNNDAGEPLYNRVTAQGIRATNHTCLTVPAVKQGLRKSGLLGQAVLKRRHYQPGPLAGATDYETLDRARSFINLYFSQLQEANFDLWDRGRQGYICTNPGIQGHLQLAASIIRHAQAEEGFDATSLPPEKLMLEVTPYLEPVLEELRGANEVSAREAFQVPYGAAGPREYHFRLCRIVRKIDPTFAPPGFEKWLEEQSQERIQRAERQLRDINIQVQAYIFATFRAKYGNEEYWEKGVQNLKMRVNAYERQQEDPKRLALENYLPFIAYEAIVSTSDHWPFFKDLFDIPERGDKGRAKNLKWMTRINELRRIPAHPTKERAFTVEDFEYLDWISAEFERRVANAPSPGDFV